MSDYSGDSQRTELINREMRERDRQEQQYVKSLEREIEKLKKQLKEKE